MASARWQTVNLLRGLNLGGIAKPILEKRAEDKSRRFIMGEFGVKPLPPEEEQKVQDFIKTKEAPFQFPEVPLERSQERQEREKELNVLRKTQNIPKLFAQREKFKRWKEVPVATLLKLLPVSKVVEMKYSGLTSKKKADQTLKELLQIEKSLGDYTLYADVPEDQLSRLEALRKNVLLEAVKQHPYLKGPLKTFQKTPATKKPKSTLEKIKETFRGKKK